MADGDFGPLPKDEALDLIERLLDDATETLNDMTKVFNVLTGSYDPAVDLDNSREDEALIAEQNAHIDRLHRLKKTITQYLP